MLKEFSMFSLNGFWGMIVLALDIWAIISIVNSDSTTRAKVIWVLLVVLLPIVGFVIWLVAGPRSARHSI
ncbi:PLD nuclease N-terminal domain-containing protein [Xinfangfangia sp. CPCC 101601]|uniref:PLD nuclease N-terminal domain-containing protein n=1 Tax=Pseudogemmobacter lacusdianii TaxID=3069608 RepID=A0ABU0VVY4_9RHOB|nr:PLD nuclease N-terminal domain-containing protein [Xinfangfangia sp. CPCC 101601]MDQ2065912.1 PLD nuclease N-terminal domain-containing protein [Xinfangfangia sp. CPCC 101601]